MSIVCNIFALPGAPAERSVASQSLTALDVVFDNIVPRNIPAVQNPLLMCTVSDSVQGEEENSKSLFVDDVVTYTYGLSHVSLCVCVTGSNTGLNTLSLKKLVVTALIEKVGLFMPTTMPRRLDI